ncbi:bifunctional glutamate/proline--tRNA ligase-like [Penaeus monodon]|uniref:bifunctional glutamate/proline--tRNA ligase-like n=1 Tax=Penaeus monodon TaxID=6687 RepID=UPI0018A75D82|nr:bifunctional glutamate/proline--tRNA ligase-like [Penaeus monodon]
MRRISLFDGWQHHRKQPKGVIKRADAIWGDTTVRAGKFNHWELKGVPLRVDVGPRDLAKKEVVAVRRDTGEKLTLPLADLADKIKGLLDEIHASLLSKAKEELELHKKLVHSWEEFTSALDEKSIMLAPFCGAEGCEDIIKKESAQEEVAGAKGPSKGGQESVHSF